MGMRARGVLAWSLITLAWLGAPAPLAADSTHYQTLQLGERSRGMAAAFTAFAADGSAIWYNPAGLPLLEAKLLQGSLSLSQIQKIKVKGALVSDGPDGPGGDDQVEDFTVNTNPTLPGFAVASFALGEKREDYDNQQPLQIAISAFQTYNNEFSGDILVTDEFGRTNSIQFARIDRQTFIGAGIGYRVVKKFLLGISVFASNRVVQHLETVSLAQGGIQDPELGSPCPTSPTIPFCIQDARQVNRNTAFKMNAWYFVTRIGLLQLVGERWRLGLMFQPPGIRMGGKSELRFELSDLDASVDPTPAESIFAARKFGANSPIPWELRMGVSYVFSKRIVADVDLQLVGPVGAGQITPNLPQIEGRANTSGVLLPTGTKRVFTWNVSVGTEVQFAKYLFGRFGFLTDNSAAPAADPNSNQSQGLAVNRYGFSTSLGGQKNARGLSVGFSALFGKGTGTGLDFRSEAFDNDANFLRAQVRERIYIISLGGDVGQTADLVTKRLKEKNDAEAAAEAKAIDEETIANETDPQLKAARERARDTKEAADAAKEELESLEEQKKQLENLGDDDQKAIQNMSQGGLRSVQ